MNKKLITFLLIGVFLFQTLSLDSLNAITAEERLEEVEKQLQAVANQINQYEGEKTDLEKAIISNDSALRQVNRELSEVQGRLLVAEKALADALAGYDTSLDNLALVQQNIVQEQTKLGKIKSEITNVKDELFETQIELNTAREGLQEQALTLYINGVMSPSTALFIDLEELSDFLAALGYASSIVDSAYKIVETLNVLENLAQTQTSFLTDRETDRQEIIDNLQIEEERKTEISIEAEEYADKVEDSKNLVESEKRKVESKKSQVLSERKNAQNLLAQANKQLELLDKEHADLEKLEEWLSKGAQVSERVNSLIKEAKLTPEEFVAKVEQSYQEDLANGVAWEWTTDYAFAVYPSETGNDTWNEKGQWVNASFTGADGSVVVEWYQIDGDQLISWSQTKGEATKE